MPGMGGMPGGGMPAGRGGKGGGGMPRAPKPAKKRKGFGEL
jgi:signal recognition particle subunit SRP54